MRNCKLPSSFRRGEHPGQNFPPRPPPMGGANASGSASLLSASGLSRRSGEGCCAYMRRSALLLLTKLRGCWRQSTFLSPSNVTVHAGGGGDDVFRTGSLTAVNGTTRSRRRSRDLPSGPWGVGSDLLDDRSHDCSNV